MAIKEKIRISSTRDLFFKIAYISLVNLQNRAKNEPWLKENKGTSYKISDVGNEF